MQLSVVIISHGHEAMLHDCLAQLKPALRDLQSETLLLDNLSAGDAERLLRPTFPDVIFINNRSPAGFAENINRAARLARGRYLLFLNPDTAYRSGSITDALNALFQKAIAVSHLTN